MFLGINFHSLDLFKTIFKKTLKLTLCESNFIWIFLLFFKMLDTQNQTLITTACVHISVIPLGLQKSEVKSQNCQILISTIIYQAPQLEVFWSINYHFTILVKFVKFYMLE